jgi:MFS transporter, FSR family, fosmidomycin resistance protein
MTHREIRWSLGTYGVLHFLVDAVGAATLFALLDRGGDHGFAAPLVIVYGLGSFATRPLFGLLVDARLSARSAALAGGMLMAIGSLAIDVWPGLAVLAMAAGNALFHVGAGSICFRIEPGRARASGYFAAPGAIGVFVGMTAGIRNVVDVWLFAAAILAGLVVIAMQPEPSREPVAAGVTPASDTSLALLLVAIAIISFGGFALRYPWQSAPSLALVMVCAAAVGRGAGGAMADRFGMARVALYGLALSIPGFALGAIAVWAAVLAMFLFNLALPVASVSVFRELPRHAGFAFGLVSLALIAGALPALTGMGRSPDLFGAALVLVAVAGLLLALAMRRPAVTTATTRNDTRRVPAVFPPHIR